MNLLDEAGSLQSPLPKLFAKRDITISKRFKNLTQKGNVNGAIKILTKGMGRGIFPLNDERLGLLRQKHPEGRGAVEDAILQGPIPTVNSIVYDVITTSII